MTHLTKKRFLHGLQTTEEFDFNWTHGPYGDLCVVGDYAADLDRLDETARAGAVEYIDAVYEAQKVAAKAMEVARDCYREGDFSGALSALQEAASAERQFGDDPTYRLLVDYMAAVVDANEALDQWEPDEADEDEIAAVFEAIFERAPDKNDDPVSDIYAATPILDAIEAERVTKVL